MTLRAIVFDFDGLILDTEWPEFQSLSETFDAHGHRVDMEWFRARIGTVSGADWLEELEAAIGETIDRDAVRAARLRRHHELIAAEDALPGITDLIDAAHAAGLGLAVASSSEVPWLEEHLTRLGLHDRFDALVGRDVVGGVGKPAPDVYLAALDRLGVGASEAVALEDSPHGLAAASAAGLACVAIPNRLTAGGDFSAAALVVDSAHALTLDTLAALVA
ncbi:HAD family hydrolase [Actinomarinicola tropica]|uniref:HAD-IA family hydrolase n=1 Tax=Actinomarinicola tropica TaxID=2789776 RepID=A0A5Q2RGY9_9ACTN|nr:HAD-IA family hydrolase [Actinomarinicola tropica]QGG93791.1 HAD-IA family hydrolase [Actinomarinicola tropica]